MTTETALPTGDNAAAGQTETPEQIAAAAALTEKNRLIDAADPPTEGEQTPEQKAEAAKPQKTAEQREIERLRRRVDNLTRQKYELRGQQQPAAQQQGTQASDDGESVTLTRAELNKQIAEQANQLAPSIAEQRAESERRNGIVKTLEKEWGKEEFDAKASDLDDAFGGLADAQGRPKPATDAIFEADDPKAVIEYLTNPDNADDAERIARLPALRAGREIARIEAKLKDEAAKAKPQPSNAAKPVTATKGSGTAQKEWAQLEGKDFFEHRRKFGARR